MTWPFCTKLPKSTLTETTRPPTVGATSVCTSAARLPVASMKRGRLREMAGAVETSTACGAAGAFAFAFAFDCAREPPQETVARGREATSIVAMKSLICLREIMAVLLLLVLVPGRRVGCASAARVRLSLLLFIPGRAASVLCGGALRPLLLA